MKFQDSRGNDIQLCALVDHKSRVLYSVKRHTGGPIRYFGVRMFNRALWWVTANSTEEFSKGNYVRRIHGVVKYEPWQDFTHIAGLVLQSPVFSD